MAKKYTRKQVGSLEELNREQERVKRLAGKMEVEWLDNILNPQQMALSLVTNLLSRKINSGGKSSGMNLFSGNKSKSESKNSGKGTMQQIAGSVMHYAKQPAVAGVAKRVGVSFLRWQAFNLAWFLGKKAVKAIQKKRAEQQLKHKVEQLIKHKK